MSEATITGYEPNGLAKWSDGAIRFAAFKGGVFVHQAKTLEEALERRGKAEGEPASRVTISAGDTPDWVKRINESESGE